MVWMQNEWTTLRRTGSTRRTGPGKFSVAHFCSPLRPNYGFELANVNVLDMR